MLPKRCLVFLSIMFLPLFDASALGGSDASTRRELVTEERRFLVRNPHSRTKVTGGHDGTVSVYHSVRRSLSMPHADRSQSLATDDVDGTEAVRHVRRSRSQSLATDDGADGDDEGDGDEVDGDGGDDETGSAADGEQDTCETWKSPVRDTLNSAEFAHQLANTERLKPECPDGSLCQMFRVYHRSSPSGSVTTGSRSPGHVLLTREIAGTFRISETSLKSKDALLRALRVFEDTIDTEPNSLVNQLSGKGFRMKISSTGDLHWMARGSAAEGTIYFEIWYRENSQGKENAILRLAKLKAKGTVTFYREIKTETFEEMVLNNYCKN